MGFQQKSIKVFSLNSLISSRCMHLSKHSIATPPPHTHTTSKDENVMNQHTLAWLENNVSSFDALPVLPFADAAKDLCNRNTDFRV
jgi:hypothetical protein